MSHATLNPGDRAYFISANGRKLRCEVADTLNLKSRGEEMWVPIIRPAKRKKNRCNLDSPNDRIQPPKIRWIERSKLRKLPK